MRWLVAAACSLCKLDNGSFIYLSYRRGFSSNNFLYSSAGLYVLFISAYMACMDAMNSSSLTVTAYPFSLSGTYNSESAA